MAGYDRALIDTAAYAERIRRDNRDGRCFICDLIAGGSDPAGPVIYRDEVCVVFFPVHPRLPGYTLLAPIEHRAGVVADFTEDEYTAIQRRVHRLGRALSSLLPTERLYVLSLGSQQAVEHVHWHLAPLPPGIPFEQQQLALLSRSDYVLIAPEERDRLADGIARSMRT